MPGCGSPTTSVSPSHDVERQYLDMDDQAMSDADAKDNEAVEKDDETDDEQEHSSLVGELFNPTAMVRRSARIKVIPLIYRHYQKGAVCDPGQLSHLCRSRRGKWFGVHRNGRGIEVTESFVKENFKPWFIQLCSKQRNLNVKIPEGRPRHNNTIQPPSFWLPNDNIPAIIQQIVYDSCVMSSLASAFSYFGDLRAQDSICENIERSLKALDRFDVAISTVCTAQLNYYPMKFGEGRFDPLTDVSPFPTLVGLCDIDGGKGHAITICGSYIFDSNAMTPLPLVAESLNWCCGSAETKGTFWCAHRAVRFLHRKPRADWLMHI